MIQVLHTEVYLLCVTIVWLCRYWSSQRSSNSTAEQWLESMLTGFLACFVSNALFSLVNGVIPPFFATRTLAWTFKSGYHACLCVGVFCWCGYADTECRGALFATRKGRTTALLPLLGMLLLIVGNLRTGWLFTLGEDGACARHGLFHLEMGLLVASTAVFGVKLLLRARSETDPVKRGYEHLVASFPLCLLITWALSAAAGESIPITCVTVTIELLCLFMGTSTQQISLDKLTQVNNRQNLLGFMEYKLLNHSEKLFLLMIDLDDFKSINDNYGHLEGDDALVRAARALKQACGGYRRRPYIARYGGDEFIVVIESSLPDAEALVQHIREALDAQNAAAQRPYSLAFSIGMAEFRPGMSAHDLIETADANLYKVKRARPHRRAA